MDRGIVDCKRWRVHSGCSARYPGEVAVKTFGSRQTGKAQTPPVVTCDAETRVGRWRRSETALVHRAAHRAVLPVSVAPSSVNCSVSICTWSWYTTPRLCASRVRKLIHIGAVPMCISNCVVWAGRDQQRVSAIGCLKESKAALQSARELRDTSVASFPTWPAVPAEEDRRSCSASPVADC